MLGTKVLSGYPRIFDFVLILGVLEIPFGTIPAYVLCPICGILDGYSD